MTRKEILLHQRAELIALINNLQPDDVKAIDYFADSVRNEMMRYPPQISYCALALITVELQLNCPDFLCTSGTTKP